MRIFPPIPVYRKFDIKIQPSSSADAYEAQLAKVSRGNKDFRRGSGHVLGRLPDELDRLGGGQCGFHQEFEVVCV